MEICDGFGRWDNLKRTAAWARVACDFYNEADEIDVEDYNKFLQEKQKNPTAADIALNKSAKKAKSTLPNKSVLERFPMNDTLVKQQEKQYAENYPKTGSLRKKLIACDRFSLDEVTPKLSKFKKCVMNLKSFL